MVFEFKMPDIGEGLQEGEIVKWLVSEGDEVEEDQPIVEVMTDKATVELPAPRTGKIAKILHDEGTVVPVGDVFVHIDEDAEGGGEGAAAEEQEAEEDEGEKEADKKAAKKEKKSEDKEEKMLFEASSSSAGGQVGKRKAKQATSPGGNGKAGKVLAAPAVRKLAREEDVDLSQVEGSGPHGRITRADLEEYIESGGGAVVQVRAKEEAPAAAPAGLEAVAVPQREREQRVPMKGLRRVIANAMHRSKNTAAHFTYVDEVDVTKLVEWRNKANKHAAERGAKLNYLPFVMKAVCAALKKFPIVNSSYDETTQELVYKHYYDIGVATATEAGLIVPVVREADRKDMFTLQEEIVDLSTRTREGTAKPDELKGSTFTITSLGKTGGMLATPVINYPEVAIMGIHAIKDKPVIKTDPETGEMKIVPGKVMNLSWSFDHRIVDGAIGADFAQYIIRLLEEPDLLLLEA